jgi:hypothetical protein
MTSDLEIGLYIFLLAGFLGYHIITRVPPLLHTPLMSATNAISGISLIGSLVVTGADYSPLSTILGTIAVACSSTNVVGGFLITDRMLKMFKRKDDQVDRARQRLAAGPILWGAVIVAVAVLVILAGAGRLDPGAAGRAHGGVSHQALSFLYIVSALLFILGLKGLSSPRWARKGMFAAELGMLMAIAGTLFHHEIASYRWIAIGIAAGSIVGATMGLRIPMTAVPQRTALSHSLGALAATLVGISEYIRQGSALGAVTMTAIGFEVIIGALTFTGSLMAAAKLQELLRGAPITYRGQNRSNMALLLAMGGLFVALIAVPSANTLFFVMVGLALLFGCLLVLPIGAADMPVVIALLNAYAGLADAAMGFVLANRIQIITGSLDGTSGFLLSMLIDKTLEPSGLRVTQFTPRPLPCTAPAKARAECSGQSRGRLSAPR